MVGYPQHVTRARKMRQFKNALFHRIRPSRKNVHPHEVKVTLNTRLDLRLRVWPKKSRTCENSNLTRLPLPKTSETCLCFGQAHSPKVSLVIAGITLIADFDRLHAKLLNPVW